MKTTFIRKPSFHRSLIIAGLAVGLGFTTLDASADNPTPQAPQAHSKDLGTAVSDTVITAKLKAKLLSEDSLGKSSIMVTTTNGVVTLDGSATDEDAVALALSDANSIEGVRSVDNNLSTPNSNKTLNKTKRVMSDSWITTKVKSVILADSVTNGVDVSVKTIHGVVVLKGALPDQDVIDHVKNLAARVDSVKSVDATALVIAHR
jgi:hyperosmotically inducible protein